MHRICTVRGCEVQEWVFARFVWRVDPFLTLPTDARYAIEAWVKGFAEWSSYSRAEWALVEAEVIHSWVSRLDFTNGLFVATIRSRTSRWRKSHDQCMSSEPVSLKKAS